MKVFALVAVLAACGSEPDVSCAEVAGAFVARIPGTVRETIRDGLVERCHVDGWSRAVRRCIATEGRRSCEGQLTPEQRDGLARVLSFRVETIEKVDTPPQQPRDIPLTLDIIDQQSAVLDGGAPRSNDELTTALRMLAGAGRKRVLVKAPSSMDIRRVGEVIDLAKQAGIDEILFAAQ